MYKDDQPRYNSVQINKRAERLPDVEPQFTGLAIVATVISLMWEDA